MQDPNSKRQFKYMSINTQNVKKPLFIPNDLLSPDKKPSKDNSNHHYDLTLAANKNILVTLIRKNSSIQ